MDANGTVSLTWLTIAGNACCTYGTAERREDGLDLDRGTCQDPHPQTMRGSIPARYLSPRNFPRPNALHAPELGHLPRLSATVKFAVEKGVYLDFHGILFR